MDVSKLKVSSAFAITVWILVLAVIEFLIFRHDSKFFLDTDIFKILMIGIGITAIIFGITVFPVSIIVEMSNDYEDAGDESVTVGVAIAGIMALSSLSIIAIFDEFFNFKRTGFTIFSLVMYILIIWIMVLSHKSEMPDPNE